MYHSLGRWKYISIFYLLIISLLSCITDCKCCERMKIILKIFLLPQKNVRNVCYFKKFHITEQWFYCDQWAMYFVSGGNIISTLIYLFCFNPEPSKNLSQNWTAYGIIERGRKRTVDNVMIQKNVMIQILHSSTKM